MFTPLSDEVSGLEFGLVAQILDGGNDLFGGELGRLVGHDGLLLFDGGFHFDDTFELAHGRTDR